MRTLTSGVALVQILDSPLSARKAETRGWWPLSLSFSLVKWGYLSTCLPGNYKGAVMSVYRGHPPPLHTGVLKAFAFTGPDGGSPPTPQLWGTHQVLRAVSDTLLKAQRHLAPRTSQQRPLCDAKLPGPISPFT